MSSFPTNGDYVQALQNTSVCFHDPALKSGRVELTPLGMPKAISGNFASVFSVTSGSGKRYAVKCFTREVQGQHRRYEAIHDALAGLEAPWRVGFDYIGQGVLVEGKWRAILRMEWVENSQTLIPWLESNLGNPGRILDVAGQFATFVADLQEAGLAHGDLQHGNLLIDSQQKLRVIDYDGMFVPSISDLGSNELGLANYQHPGRTGNDFGPYLDRFSAWIIYGSLLSLAAQPGLWWTFRNAGDEKLLLSKEDFIVPLNTLERLKSLGPPHAEFVDVLAQSLSPSATIAEVPAFDPKLLSLPVPGQPPAQDPSAQPSDWWRDQTRLSGVSTTEEAEHNTPLGPDWIKTHAPPLPPVEIVGPGIAAKSLSLAVTAISIVGAIALVAGSRMLLGGLVVLTWAAAMTIGTWRLWQRSDALIGRAAARRQLKQANREVDRQNSEISKLQKQRGDLDGAERKDLQKLEDQRAKLPQASTSEIESQSKGLRKQLKALQTDLNKLEKAKAAEVSKQLRLIQQQHIQTYMARQHIEPGVIPGIGPSLAAALSVHGLRTAADFAGFNGTQFRTTASSYWFTVTGIGPAKSDAIHRWYQRQLSAAQSRAPQSLPAQQTQAVESMFAARKQQQQSAIDATSKQLQGVKSAVEQKYAAVDKEITQKAEAVRRDYQQRRSVGDAAITQAEIELRNKESAVLDAQRNLDRYRDVSVSSYLKA